MRNSIWRCSIVIVALSVACFSTGCRSGGWGLPGSSWVSWGKKKPPASSIAGTRSDPQPPSVTYPPFSSDESGTPSAVASTGNSYPSTSSSAAAAPFPGSAGSSGAYAARQASASGIVTGPFDTGGGTTASTQNGFYAPSYPQPGGPAAATADTRSNMYPSSGAASSAIPSSGGSFGAPAYSPPANYGARPAESSAPPIGMPFGSPSAGTPGSSMTTPSYPTNPTVPSYPSTPSSNNYPSTPDSPYPSTPSTGYPANSSGAPAYPSPSAAAPVTSSSYPGSYATPGSYAGAVPSPTSAATTGSVSDTYNTPIPSGYPMPQSYGAAGAYPSPTSPATAGRATTGFPGPSSSYPSSGAYLPGSTGRGGEVLGTTPTHTASPSGSSPYPNTLNR